MCGCFFFCELLRLQHWEQKQKKKKSNANKIKEQLWVSFSCLEKSTTVLLMMRVRVWGTRERERVRLSGLFFFPSLFMLVCRESNIFLFFLSVISKTEAEEVNRINRTYTWCVRRCCGEIMFGAVSLGGFWLFFFSYFLSCSLAMRSKKEKQKVSNDHKQKKKKKKTNEIKSVFLRKKFRLSTFT